MLQVHRLLGTWKKIVTAYIAVSPFVKDKLIDMGVPEKKIYLKPNFIQPKIQKSKTISFGKYYLFVGRLEEEKGILNLLNAYQDLKSEYPLYIIGSGNLQSIVEKYALENPKNSIFRTNHERRSDSVYAGGDRLNFPFYLV
ncbi:glycosyltransferase [Picosynechococcus sp. NKBG15041c]|uniref:glycosyltransferase n=1 Tax=Picosynechococcus sp. NKBG15041c TaxID=1407650 RepID=UPI0011DCE2E1|nr:glycosyltransferase [Picosynechococcus sp. NKBG15041c]